MRDLLRRFAQTPFGRLVDHFLDRLIRGGQDPNSELDLGVYGLLGILAAPAAFSCFLLIDKYSTFLNWYRGRHALDYYLTSIPDKYMFISVAMAVAGMITVLKWDQTLPDPQDYLNLAPLPIRRARILLANATAIVFSIVVVCIDVNVLPSFLFPMLVTAAAQTTASALLHFSLVHMICVALASLFSICAVFGILGTFSAILPRETFRSCSSWLRGIILLALIALLLSGLAGHVLVRQVERFPDSAIRYLPSLWYLGLYQTLQHRGTTLLADLGRMGLLANAVALILLVVSYLAGYRRRFAGVLEGARRPSKRRLAAVMLFVLDSFANRRAGFERAYHRFIVRALLRNESHRLTIAVSIGLGWLLAIQSLAGSLYAGMRQAPLIAAYLLILGLRLAFELPASASASWVFQTVLDMRRHETPPLARRVVISFLVPCVFIPTAILWAIVETPLNAAVHMIFLLALSVTLLEIQLAGYRKVPLACPMPGFRDNLIVLCLIQFVGFQFFTRFVAGLEVWMFANPIRFLWIPVWMAVGWYWRRRRIAEEREQGVRVEGLTFENAPIVTVERLNLSDGL